jgi:hypothetical protein
VNIKDRKKLLAMATTASNQQEFLAKALKLERRLPGQP